MNDTMKLEFYAKHAPKVDGTPSAKRVVLDKNIKLLSSHAQKKSGTLLLDFKLENDTAKFFGLKWVRQRNRKEEYDFYAPKAPKAPKTAQTKNKVGKEKAGIAKAYQKSNVVQFLKSKSLTLNILREIAKHMKVSHSCNKDKIIKNIWEGYNVDDEEDNEDDKDDENSSEDENDNDEDDEDDEDDGDDDDDDDSKKQR